VGAEGAEPVVLRALAPVVDEYLVDPVEDVELERAHRSVRHEQTAPLEPRAAQDRLGGGEPIRRCLACNTCINEMRGGARIGCVVNGAAGRETLFANPQPPRGERIAVIGAGPAGLTYASLVADGNTVTVFEKARKAGGSFRYAGKAPLFQEVEANPKSFERYVTDMVAACKVKGVAFRFATDVSADPELLAPFDRIVIATGAAYRYGLGAVAPLALDSGAARWPGMAQAFSSGKLRDWFYYRARRATGDRFKPLARAGQIVVVIGDAVRAGKSKPVIASAFEAALLRPNDEKASS